MFTFFYSAFSMHLWNVTQFDPHQKHTHTQGGFPRQCPSWVSFSLCVCVCVHSLQQQLLSLYGFPSLICLTAVQQHRASLSLSLAPHVCLTVLLSSLSVICLSACLSLCYLSISLSLPSSLSLSQVDSFTFLVGFLMNWLLHVFSWFWRFAVWLFLLYSKQ